MGKATGIKIDAMRVKDLDQVLEIEQTSFSMPWSKKLFLAELSKPSISTLLVALAEDDTARKVIGYIVFWIVEEEMHILNLATAPAVRRQGIATQLVLVALRYGYARGAKAAYLEVRASNVAAQNLYASLGFARSYVRKGYYDMPIEDAVVMTLDEKMFRGLIRHDPSR